jgi:hypothetical protein
MDYSKLLTHHEFHKHDVQKKATFMKFKTILNIITFYPDIHAFIKYKGDTLSSLTK